MLENHVHAELSQKTDSDDSRILIQSAPSPHPMRSYDEHSTGSPRDAPRVLTGASGHVSLASEASWFSGEKIYTFRGVGNFDSRFHGG